MPQQLVDLPHELILHMMEFVIITDNRTIRFESNIKNLCNFELISKQLKVREYLEKYWKMVLYQFIHIRLEINEDGKEVIQPINPWDVWKKKDQTLQEFVERKRSFKRSFAILNEMERRNYLNTNKANFKLCITGPGGSGIHSFIHRYLNDVFYDQYDYSIDDIFYKTILFNERKVELEIWETGFRSSDYYLFLECKFL